MKYIAADFGAGSGRVIVGSLAPDKSIELEEIHRFANRQISLNGRVYWDFLSLFEELKTGLRIAFSKYGSEIKSIGVDTWGVDYGLIGKDGYLISNPVCYRDNRTHGMLGEAFKVLPKDEFFQLAGNQFMEINTAFQLLSCVKGGDAVLGVADKLLFMPDLFNYFLSGRSANEYTIASTSQLLNSKERVWDKEIFAKLGLPMGLMQEIVYPGCVLGRLLRVLLKKLGEMQMLLLLVRMILQVLLLLLGIMGVIGRLLVLELGL
jgi:Sugar (pentulose and hexulose) kinases